MSHLLEQDEQGNASMLYYGEVPWHGLGTRLENPATAIEAMQIAKLDFTVEKIPAFAEYEGNMLVMPDRYATIRTDKKKILGAVGSKYTVVQNTDLFGFFDPIISRDEAVYHTAGVIDGGKKVWLLAKLPTHIRVREDVVDQYVLLFGSHDGSTPVVAKYTPVRVVCNNTVQIALNAKSGLSNEVRVRHTVTAEQKIQESHKILGMVNLLQGELEYIFNQMASTKMTGEMLAKFIDDTFPGTIDPKSEATKTKAKNTRELVYELVENGIGMQQEATKGTLYGAYNAITEYADHVKFDNDTDPNDRLNSIWFGSSKKLAELAYINAMKFLS